MRKVDQEPGGRGHVVLVASVPMLVPMLRIVPVVKRFEVVRVDLLCQEVQVFSRWPMGMEPRVHPAECRSEEQTGQQDEEVEKRPP